MAFLEEPKGYAKTILSDLQGAWSVLLHLVADNAGFEGWDRILPHIHEAMSWESVRNLHHMRSTLLIVRNLALQNKVSEEIMQEITDITEILEEAIAEYKN
jgi:hypothetical protein